MSLLLLVKTMDRHVWQHSMHDRHALMCMPHAQHCQTQWGMLPLCMALLQGGQGGQPSLASSILLKFNSWH